MTFARLREAAREHANFPKYTLAADAIAIVIQQFVPVFLTGMFGPAIAGLYSFSARVVRVPLIVVATSVANVLRREAIEQIERTGSLLAICRRTVGGLSLVAIGPFALLFIFATPIFAGVFGGKWSGAGPVVRVLAPGLLLEFIAFPLFVVFLVTQTQRYAFRLQLASIALLFASLFAGRYYWNSFLATCALMSFAMVLTNGSTVAAAFVASKPPRSIALEGVGAVP
jgi:O-antigen/teichoic acid export membrane protein